MKNLRTLALLAIGAFVITAVYVGAVDESDVDIALDAEEGRTVTHVMDGERGEFRFQDDDISLEAQWRGSFTLNADGDDIEALDNKLYVELEENGETEKAVFEDHRDGVKKRYFRYGEEMQDVEAAAENASELFVRFLRISGLEYEQRVGALLDAGDTEAALSEIAALESDLAIRRYALALSDQRSLSARELAQLAQSFKKIEGDQDLRLVVGGLLEAQQADADSIKVLLETASDMESSHDIRKLLESVAATSINQDVLDRCLLLFARIEGDHDLRKAAEALIKSEDVSPEQQSLVLLAAAGRIESDRDTRMLLEDTAQSLSKAPELASAWLDGFNTLESSRDQRLSLVKAAAFDQYPRPSSTAYYADRQYR